MGSKHGVNHVYQTTTGSFKSLTNISEHNFVVFNVECGVETVEEGTSKTPSVAWECLRVGRLEG